jgi:hypothetical protein
MAERRNMQKHITLLGVFHIVYHALGFLVGIVILAIMAAIGRLSGDPQAAYILRIVGAWIAVFFIVLSVPGIVAGVWLLYRRSWARYLTLVVGALGLIDIPLGTALGVYTFWVLLDDDAIRLFGQPEAPMVTAGVPAGS